MENPVAFFFQHEKNIEKLTATVCYIHTAKNNNDRHNWELQLQSIFQFLFKYATLVIFPLAEHVSVSFTTLEIRFPLRLLYLHSDGHLAK